MVTFKTHNLHDVGTRETHYLELLSLWRDALFILQERVKGNFYLDRDMDAYLSVLNAVNTLHLCLKNADGWNMDYYEDEVNKIDKEAKKAKKELENSCDKKDAPNVKN